MKKLIFSICAVFALVTILSTGTSYAQTKKPIGMAGKAVAASRGANPNIKGDIPKTDAPKSKSRSAACSITLDNYTGYYIKVYVDGYYKGTLDAYGKGTVVVSDGYKTVYCVTVGGTKEWSAAGNCTNSSNYFTIQ